MVEDFDGQIVKIFNDNRSPIKNIKKTTGIPLNDDIEIDEEAGLVYQRFHSDINLLRQHYINTIQEVLKIFDLFIVLIRRRRHGERTS
jgi:hypothetical protein